METRWGIFLIIGAPLIIFGIIFLYFSYQFYVIEDLAFNFWTLIIFMQIAPPLPSNIFDFYYFSFSSYILDFYFSIYNLLLDVIHNLLGSFLFSFGVPFAGFLCLCLGGMFIVLTIINIRKEYYTVKPPKKEHYKLDQF